MNVVSSSPSGEKESGTRVGGPEGAREGVERDFEVDFVVVVRIEAERVEVKQRRLRATCGPSQLSSIYRRKALMRFTFWI